MADIKIARVDFRLIHGQVITKWIKYYPVDMIVIADDILANDAFMAEIYEMAVPKGIKFKIVSLNEAKEVLHQMDASVFLLFRDVDSCTQVVKSGVSFDFLVVGGVPGEPGRKLISDGISLHPEEFAKLDEIKSEIKEIIFKGIPEESEITLEKVREKF